MALNLIAKSNGFGAILKQGVNKASCTLNAPGCAGGALRSLVRREANEPRTMQRIFSGIQPSGIPTLGNYLGALRNWAALQDGHECIYCVVDLHAITQFQNPADLTRQTREMAATLLAIGIDPKKHILFLQSGVRAHAQLAWLFNCVARIGWLNRMTQFKDKAGKDRENASAGLYVYPNLMAADILAYHATRVPVGDDQRQHLELANDIAQKFNHDYGVDFFPNIEPLIMGPAARVMSLRDGTKKMSKSDPSDQSRINLNDDPETIALKVRRAKTDPEPLPSEAEGLAHRPEARNLVGIYAALDDSDHAAVLREHGGKGFGDFKKVLADLLVDKLTPIAAETKRLLADPGTIDAILREGAGRAAAIADPIVAKAEDLVGFLRP
jgi:tryptophanyl-tRNA synthetase